MKWQSIDTAPRDGTPVLIHLNGGMTRIACWKDRGAFGTGWRDPIGHAENAAILGEPLHWMPLPDPPAAPRKRAGKGVPRRRNRSAMAV
jgi:hypothetical protein